MHVYEYKVVTAPRSARRIKGMSDPEARFAMTVEELLNESAKDGWEFIRSETLTCEHRRWFSRKVAEQALLVFRRGKGEVVGDVPEMPGHLRTPEEPRLAAERGAPRRASFTSLRMPPAPGHDGERG